MRSSLRGMRVMVPSRLHVWLVGLLPCLLLGCSLLNKPRIACDPVTGSPGCDSAGTWCEITSEDPQTTDCTSRMVGSSGPGGSCSSTDDCAAGLGCIENGGVPTCRHMCRVGMPRDCDSSFSCVVPQGSAIVFGFCC